MSLAALACDQGDPELSPVQGPPLGIVATYPAAGEGLDCGFDGPPDCGVPRDVTFELRLDRYLDPSTAVRQAVLVYTGSEELSVFFQPEYDVVERVVSYRLVPGARLAPGARYTVEIFRAEGRDTDGLRAFDGAPVGEGAVPLVFDFRTQRLDLPDRTEPPAPATCADVLAAFKAAGCAGQSCHDSATPRMGLDLSSREGLLTTAISRVAHQAETGSKAGAPLEDPPRVGTQMPIIDPGRPDNSYLLYKLLRKARNFDNTALGCSSAHGVPLAGTCPKPDAAESARLREWFVRGEPMPLAPDRQIDPRPIQSWIRSGAACP